MASSDAKPYPQKNVAYRITFPILDADGDLVTGATGLDSEVSKDGGTFADCTNEATEIATSSGMYYLDLTSTEMNADTVSVIIKTSSSGAKTTAIVMYPEEAGDIRVNVTQIGSQNVGLSSDNRLKVDVAEWNDTPLATTNPLPNAAPGAANGVFIAGTNAATTITTGLTTTFTGNLTGGINTGSGTITTLDGLDTAQDTQHAITQAAVSAIGITGGTGLNYPAEADNVSSPIKSISLVGTETSGTYASTEADDGTYHQITGSATALDIVYQLDVTAIRKCVAVQWRGYVSGLNDTITVQAYDFVGSDWETRTTIAGQAGTTNITVNIPMLSKHTGTGTDIGLVLVRFVCTGQTNPILNTDLLLAEGAIAGQTVGYADGAVWIDTVNGTAGTAPFVNGVADNTVLTLADGLTIATALGIANFRVINGSTITLASTTANKVFEGNEWALALGGQNIASSTFIDASVSGTASGSAAEFEGCQIGNVTMEPSQYYSCTFNGTFTVGSTGDFLFMDCASQVAGSGSPVFDFAAIGATTVSFRRWSGGLTVNNMATGDVLSIDVVSGGTITINGADGNVQVRGMCNVVDNRTGSPTLGLTNNMDYRFDNLDTAAADIPTVSEFNARTLVAADYATNTDLDALITTVGAAGAGLTALATQASVNDLPTNAELATALGTADDAVLAAIAALNNLSAAQVNAEVVDALATDTYAEPGQAAPSATATLAAKINYLYKAWRNKKTQTATTFSLFADDTTTVDQKATVSDDGTTTTIGEIATGP